MAASGAAFGAPSELVGRQEATQKRPRACVGCGGRSIGTEASPICRECLEKIAGFNAMQEALTDALVSTERVAVAVPHEVDLPHVPAHAALAVTGRVAGLWSGYPSYVGDLADIDHVNLVDAVPPTHAGHAYLESHGSSERLTYRLVPAHAAKHLAGIEYALHVLAEAAYSAGLAAGRSARRGAGQPTLVAGGADAAPDEPTP